MKRFPPHAHSVSSRPGLLLLLLPLLAFAACSSNTGGAGGPRTDVAASADAPGATSETATPGGTTASSARTAPADAWAAIRSGALLVDVRTQAEYEQGHLEGALLIPHDQIASRVTELGEDKGRAIVLYCRSGNRSSQAKRALEELGYTNVMNAGGYDRLKQAQ